MGSAAHADVTPLCVWKRQTRTKANTGGDRRVRAGLHVTTNGQRSANHALGERGCGEASVAQSTPTVRSSRMRVHLFEVHAGWVAYAVRPQRLPVWPNYVCLIGSEVRGFGGSMGHAFAGSARRAPLDPDPSPRQLRKGGARSPVGVAHILAEWNALFHDTRAEEVDPEAHGDFVIARVLDRGTISSVGAVLRYYGRERVRAFLCGTGANRVSRRTLPLWRAFLRITPNECTRDSCSSNCRALAHRRMVAQAAQESA